MCLLSICKGRGGGVKGKHEEQIFPSNQRSIWSSAIGNTVNNSLFHCLADEKCLVRGAKFKWFLLNQTPRNIHQYILNHSPNSTVEREFLPPVRQINSLEAKTLSDHLQSRRSTLSMNCKLLNTQS